MFIWINLEFDLFLIVITDFKVLSNFIKLFSEYSSHRLLSSFCTLEK